MRIQVGLWIRLYFHFGNRDMFTEMSKLQSRSLLKIRVLRSQEILPHYFINRLLLQR